MRSCSTCQHLKRPEIDRRLAAGEPTSHVARAYDINLSSLHRHRVNCLKLGASGAIKKDAARGTAAVCSGNGRLNSGQHNPAARAAIQRKGNNLSNYAELRLGPEASAELRDRLLRELNDLGSGDDAALWAHWCLPEKNKLNAADAERVDKSSKQNLRPFCQVARMYLTLRKEQSRLHTVRIGRSRRSGTVKGHR